MVRFKEWDRVMIKEKYLFGYDEFLNVPLIIDKCEGLGCYVSLESNPKRSIYGFYSRFKQYQVIYLGGE